TKDRLLDAWTGIAYRSACNATMNPEIIIEYCTARNYEPKAVSLAEKILALKQRIGALKLVPSGGGAFEISDNGKKIYSKLQTGEFPDSDAILKTVKSKL